VVSTAAAQPSPYNRGRMDALLCVLIFATLWSLRRDSRPLFLALFAASLVAVLLWFRYHVSDPLALNF
jgi:hypothetical protein